jgi:cytochrome c553
MVSRFPLLSVCVVAVAAVLMMKCGYETTAHAAPAKTASMTPAEHGRYLVTITGCNDCHSPKLHPGTMAPDPALLLSGRSPHTPPPEKPAKFGDITASGDLTAWWGPWGVSYAANLPPDPTTGIGRRYIEASFLRAMRTGKKPEGTDMLPPMPWQDFSHMSDGDLKAIWAYLRTLRPVKNNVKVSGS